MPSAATDPTPVADSAPATEAVPTSTAADRNEDVGPKGDRHEFDQRRKAIVKSMSELDLSEIATQHGTGSLAVKDIIMTLKRPAWDPRDKVRKPIFRRGIVKVDDLKPEMQLEGQVVNVVDFGVFVDIGLGESSLVHVSQLSNHYIADPHKVFAVGDAMKVWVTEVSATQRRVRLTAIRPGVKKTNFSRRRPNRLGQPSPAPTRDQRGQPVQRVRPTRRLTAGHRKVALVVVPVNTKAIRGGRNAGSGSWTKRQPKVQARYSSRETKTGQANHGRRC